MKAEYDVVFKAESEYVERLVCFESVADQDSWSAISTLSSGRLKYSSHPFQVDVGVHVAFLAARELPIWALMADPVAPEVDYGESDERRQAPTVSRDALDCRGRGSLGVGASVGLGHFGTYKVLGRSKHTEQYSRLIHIVYILLKDVRLF